MPWRIWQHQDQFVLKETQYIQMLIGHHVFGVGAFATGFELIHGVKLRLITHQTHRIIHLQGKQKRRQASLTHHPDLPFCLDIKPQLTSYLIAATRQTPANLGILRHGQILAKTCQFGCLQSALKHPAGKSEIQGINNHEF